MDPREEQALLDELAFHDALSATKKEIILLLKKQGEMDLESLSKALNKTKMGILKHVTVLEDLGFIARSHKNVGVGRPRLVLTLTPLGQNLFPKAYAEMAVFALEYLEQSLGRQGVIEALKYRQQLTRKQCTQKLKGKSFEERIKLLARIRDSEGYMAEFKKISPNELEILEYNCPVLAIAQRFSEACTVEREMFQELLEADVETTHRVVDGHHVCRFVIRRKNL